MKIDAEKFRRALFSQEGDPPKFVHPSKAYSGWVAALPVPSDLKDFLTTLCLQDEFSLGTNVLHTPDGIISANTEFSYIVDGGFVMIGAASCGDMVAIKFKNTGGDTGYLSHDDLWLWDEAEYPNPQDYFRKIADSVGEYAYMALDSSSFPLDYYGAMPEQEG